MRTKPFIITLTGASRCGKTYFTERIIELEGKIDDVQFKPRRHWKYVTRSYRENEIIEQWIKNTNENDWVIDVKSVKTIPDDCEFVYRTYGEEYGLKKEDLCEYLSKGESPIIVINDVRVVEELKKEFPNQVLSLFLFREIIQDKENHKKAGELRGGVSETESISRFEKAVALYRVFIENIFLFDRVVLNVPHAKADDLAQIQAEGIIRGVIEEKILLNKKIIKSPKLFIVSGNAQSGKDDIIRAAKNLGKLQTDILIKHTTRREEDGDEGEIICQFKPKFELLQKYENEFQEEIRNFEKMYSFENYLISQKDKIQNEFEKGKNKYNSQDELAMAMFHKEKLVFSNGIKTKYERFWQVLKNEIEKREYEQIKDLNEKKIVYLSIRNEYFERNNDYIDLEKIKFENEELYKSEIGKIIHRNPSKKENDSACLLYKGERFILYTNNKNLPDDSPIYYGYEIDKYVEKLKENKKHIVLTASLPNMFRICRECFGSENVVTAYTYSQISQDEHKKHSDKMTGDVKIQEYDDILRYAHHISDFDYALIFAETSIVNKSGNQKDELVDQMFRLFRIYNSSEK